MNRRGFLGAILAACTAPAIVRADSLMRIVPRETGLLTGYEWLAPEGYSWISVVVNGVTHRVPLYPDCDVTGPIGEAMRLAGQAPATITLPPGRFRLDGPLELEPRTLLFGARKPHFDRREASADETTIDMGPGATIRARSDRIAVANMRFVHPPLEPLRLGIACGPAGKFEGSAQWVEF